MTERDRRRRIIEHLSSGETEEAANEMAASRERYPGDEALHRAIGLAFASHGTLDRALEQLETAASLDPDSAEILADLAQVQLAQGQADQAMETAERAVELAPSLAIARFTLGRAHFLAECRRQARRPPAPDPHEHFPLVDGRAPSYLRAVQEMEAALDASPPFSAAIRVALALAYQRAGHYHAAAQQLRAHVEELPAGEQAEEARQRLQDLEHEIIREDYWAASATAVGETRASANREPEAKLRLAHGYATAGDSAAAATAMAEAREAGYRPRDADVTLTHGATRRRGSVADAHILIAGGLECVIEGQLRYLPFAAIQAIRLGEVRLWRPARVELLSGEEVEALVPAQYRLSLRSPSDLIQTGWFTQFSYGPGETRWAYAIGARNLGTDSGVIPFGEVRSVVFCPD